MHHGSARDASARSDREVEWQFDALDVRPVERWLRPPAAPGNLSEGADVRPGQTRTLVDLYVDSDDWRFHRAGYSLRLRRQGRAVEATLKSIAPATGGLRDRLEVSETVGSFDLEALRSAGGEVGGLVRSMAGSRPLRPVLHVRTRRRTYGVDVRGAAAAELALDQTSMTPGDGQEPVRLRRVEVELKGGAAAELQPFVRAMSRECGLRPAELSKFEAGLMALGLGPPPPRDLGPSEIGATSSTGEVAFALLRRHFAAFEAKEPGTRLGEDPEELHDMRVATRRLRAAIKLFEDILPVRVVRAREEFRWVARALGQVRDLDVQLQQLEAWIGEAGQEDREPLSVMRSLLREERERHRLSLFEMLDSRRYERLVEGFAALLRHGPLRTSAASRVPAVAAAPELVRSRYRKLRKAARRVGEEASPEDFHRLRIRGKRMRYALESVSELYVDGSKPLIRRLEGLQDVLGLLQDARVAVDRLRRLAATEGLPPTTIFAMGEVAERYAHRAEALERRAPKAYGKARGKRWRKFRRLMEQARVDAAWRERPTMLRPVANPVDGPVAPPSAGPA